MFTHLVVPLAGDADTIRARMRSRTGHFMGERMLAGQLAALEEPTPDEALRILQGLAPRYAEHHGVRYTGPALKGCVELARDNGWLLHTHASENPEEVQLMRRAAAISAGRAGRADRGAGSAGCYGSARSAGSDRRCGRNRCDGRHR